MDPPASLRDRDPLDAVDAALELEAAPRPATLDEEDRVLDAPRTGRAGVHDLDFPALALRVLRVHTHEVRGAQRPPSAAPTSAPQGRGTSRNSGQCPKDKTRNSSNATFNRVSRRKRY